MKRFIKGIGFYFFIIITILFLIGYQGFDLFKIKKIGENRLLNKKIDYFETFIKDKNSINLILGSSITRDLIIPDSLRNNWFSFTNSLQNIYNSYKFLEFYQDLVKIDTIIIGIQSFDFPYSYIKNRQGNLPNINSDFYIFGYDSINIKKNIIYKKIQNYKNYFFPDLLDMQILNKQGDFRKKRDIWTKQGFSGAINAPILNLDSLYNIQLKKNKRKVFKYFYNVNKNPNIKYFDLFNNLTDSLNIKVIYLITPKSKYYHLDLAKYEYDSIWNNILDSLESRKVEVWNYETMNTDTFKFDWYQDDTHSSYDGARAFTKIIRKRLRD
jgi:hypothetical protein